ncbi:hypothetical protein HHK36_032623 [Tetracentron sinense]|uniref:Uncharacterized protein n=1 Tax=Tetracentron sinense TaxID=13715 RepID=A0A834Y9Z7_TETSI|nr:hypothetical protein HHK36_032623 [Tetracentron sinense]
MGLVIVSQSPSLISISLRRAPSPASPSRIRYRVASRRWFNPSTSSFRVDNFISRCSITNTDVHFNHVTTEEDAPEELSSIPPSCSVPVVHLKSEILENESLNLLDEETYLNNLLTTLPVLSEEEQNAIAATPAHPTGLYGKSNSYFSTNKLEYWCSFMYQ